MTTPFLRWIALTLLLYSQVILAFEPCVSRTATPSNAFADMPGDCPMNAKVNLCLAHCLVADQGGTQVQIPALPSLNMPVLVLPRQEQMHLLACVFPPEATFPPTGPPPLSQFCSFQL